MKIAFERGEYSVVKRNCVAFLADVDGQRVTCRVTFAALMTLPDAHRRHHLTTFRVYRNAIEELARRMIRERGLETNRFAEIVVDGPFGLVSPVAASA